MAKKKSKSELSEPGITDEEGKRGSSDDAVLEDTALGSAPKPSEAEAAKAAAKDKEGEPSPPKRTLPVVPLRVFQALSGIKPDKFKPFIRHTIREDMRPCTVVEWRARFDAFLKKPTR